MTRDNIWMLERVRALSPSEWEELKSKLFEMDADPVKEPEKTFGVTEHKVTELFREIGIPANILGHKYLRRAIIICAEDPEIMHRQVTTFLYPTLAKEFKTTRSRVERAMRHAIETSWDRGDINVHDQIFGNSIWSERGKPTNCEFIAGVIEYLKQHS